MLIKAQIPTHSVKSDACASPMPAVKAVTSVTAVMETLTMVARWVHCWEPLGSLSY